jgi:hypothetical protein
MLHVWYMFSPTKLGDLKWANVGENIPAPWSIWDL